MNIILIIGIIFLAVIFGFIDIPVTRLICQCIRIINLSNRLNHKERRIVSKIHSFLTLLILIILIQIMTICIMIVAIFS